jgi:TolB protein
MVRRSAPFSLAAFGLAAGWALAGCSGSGGSVYGPQGGESPAPVPSATPSEAVSSEGLLLFSRFDEESETFVGMFVSHPDGSDEVEVPLPFTEGDGAWSRSGSEIAVATQLEDERIGTAILSTDGTVLRTLDIPDPSLNLPCGVWSLDDSRLWCEGWDDADPSRAGTYTVRASDGGDLQRVTTPPKDMRDLQGDYSPDGQLVFKRFTGDEGAGDLMLVDESGGEPKLLAAGSFEDPGRFSPDGKSVLTSTEGQIVILDLEGKATQTIADPDAFLFGPVWSPDGSRIAFSSSSGGFIADIFTSLPDGTDRQQVTETPANEINVDWGVDAG